MTMNDISGHLLIAGTNVFWNGITTLQITVMDPANGHILDVWAYMTN